MGAGIRVINMKKEKSRRRRRRQSRHVNRHKRSMLAVSAVIVLLMAVVSANAVSLLEKDRTYQAQEIELEKQIDAEKERSVQIDELEKYVGTDEYVEEVAKDKLGLVNENEIIFKAK